MLEVLQGLIQQAGQSAVVQNPQVPNEHNEGVMDEVMQGLLGGLSNQANSQGGLGSLIGLLGNGSSGNLMSNPIVGNIAQSVVGNLMEKFGLSNSAAASVVGNMLPSVLGTLIDKTNDPNDSSIDLGGLMGTITGGKTNGIDFGSLLSQGANALADGKLDMNDIMNIAGSAMGGQKQQGSGGGIGDLLGGLFGGK
ncbi:hypothetical protein Emtol_4055 [Emticicia oligotrophica DSM 17448]|uniref:DUF937 domain-containing protein n=1 Tax=Emticicia oligotrophica (strain DSM 17448 / CIP 109782 / MTCC 6937 / GPTSA100-15) TaxID=929562 RepID=A0ABN4ASN7_EMTOG|nr:DUF937 domain-containing protein [Emticicia oligotrophica]AFK05180.1 hypothetical protein Emtol_4055 [Emticicia oligotrophica DSM 17448]